MNCPTGDCIVGSNDLSQIGSRELWSRASSLNARNECGGKADGEYNLPLHVIALFIVLVQSILSCSLPLLVKKFPQLKIPRHFLFLSKHFGTGVLIATAFVHLLPTAFTSLTDPCLPAFWNESYPAMAGLIAMISVFFVVTIEMLFSIAQGGEGGGCHSAVEGYDVLTPSGPLFGHKRGGSTASNFSMRGAEEFLDGSLSPRKTNGQAREGRSQGFEQMPTPLSTLSEDGETLRNGTYKLTPPDESDDELEGEGSDMGMLDGRPIRRRSRSGEDHSYKPSSSLTEEQQRKKAKLQVMLLEAGILFHSVFIGMALSVATGSNFIVLLIAIVFHQTFEGLALGSRIAALQGIPDGSLQQWLMCLAYGTTTPIGQAIGLATRNLYDPASQTGLLMVGMMNAISSGLLLFAGLVELLAEDFLSDESYHSLQGKRRVQASCSVLGGAGLMALVGAWA